MPVIIPGRIVDIVQPVRPIDGATKTPRRMAGGALHDGPGIPLERPGRDIVIASGIGIRPYRMGAAMTPLATNAAMSLAEFIKRIRLFGEPLIGSLQRRG